MDEYRKMDWKDQVRFTIDFNTFNKENYIELDKLRNNAVQDLNNLFKSDNRNKKIDDILNNQ